MNWRESYSIARHVKFVTLALLALLTGCGGDPITDLPVSSSLSSLSSSSFSTSTSSVFSSSSSGNSMSGPAFERGKAIYHDPVQKCATCHGVNGGGGISGPINVGAACENTDCSDASALTAYISASMPLGDTGICVDEPGSTCASDVSAYIVGAFNTGEIDNNDADGDGVLDGVDQCPNTLAEDIASIDSTGCKAAGTTPVPTVIFAVNAGGAAYTAKDGTQYGADADQYHTASGQSGDVNTAVAGTDDDVLYATERFASTGTAGFEYKIPLVNDSYSVELHFAEVFFTEAAKRQFDVSIEGQLKINDLDTFVAAGGNLVAHTLTFDDIVVADGELTINFVSVIENAQVSAIKVVGNIGDSDNDGVSNLTDNCPGTLPDAVVNANGCSTAQLDKDNDGIPIPRDICPNTAAEQVLDVASNGCSSQELALECNADNLARPIIRRLNVREYQNTVRELFGRNNLSAEGLPADTRNSWNFDNDGSELRFLSDSAQAYLRVAEAVAADVFAGGSPFANLCQNVNASGCANAVADDYLPRVFRRPISELNSERERFIQLMLSESNAAQGAEKAVTASLMSPSFLLIRTDESQTLGDIHRLTPYELAERLSYFLWSSMPDAELFRVAQNGTLTQSAALLAQAQRMMADAKHSTFATTFSAQWLAYEKLPKEIRSNFGNDYNEQRMNDMLAETNQFVGHVYNNNLPPSEFILADYSFLTPDLAQHYGATGNPDSEGKTALPEGRRGILTQGSILTITGANGETNPIQRGVYVADHILCTPLPDPPADIPTLDDVDPNLSIAERLAAHRTNRTCAACHDIIDPLGMGLENFNSIGQWRTTYEEGDSVESSGVMPSGIAYSGPADYVDALNGDKLLGACFTERVAAYAIGATHIRSGCFSDALSSTAKIEASGTRDIVLQLINSDLFRAQAKQGDSQ